MKMERTIQTEENDIPLEMLSAIDAIQIFYYPEERRFKTNCGETLLNFYPLVPPDIVLLFLRDRKTMTYFNYKYRVKITLLYPLESEERITA